MGSSRRRLQEIERRQRRIADELQEAFNNKDVSCMVALHQERNKLENQKAIISRDAGDRSLEDPLLIGSLILVLLAFGGGVIFRETGHGWLYDGLSWAVWAFFPLLVMWLIYAIVIKIVIRNQ